jgi:uncharacterized membrane protein YphA (DoxX/SURF4 family)
MVGAIVLLLAFVFALAGISKLLSPDRFRATLRKLMPLGAATVMVRAIPLTELLLAAWLVSGLAPRQAAGIAIIVLLMFTAALLRMLRKGLGGCGCFGEAADSAPAGLVRNVLLIALAACVALPQNASDGPWSSGEGAIVGRLTLVLGAACLWSCLVALVERRSFIFSTNGPTR